MNWLGQKLLGFARNWKRHLGTLALAIAVLLAVQAWQTRDVQTGPLSTELLDTSVVVLMPGQAEQLMSLRQALALDRGAQPEPVALYVWAEWCPICKTLRSTADAFTQDHPALTIAMQSGPHTQVNVYLKQHQLAWPTVVDSSGELTRRLGFKAVPSFAIVTTQDELQTPTVGLTSSWGMRLRWWWAKLF